MVALENRAHHATYYNSRSIGIEMAGFAGQASTWNENNMRALESLVAWLVHRYRIPAVQPPGDARTYPGCEYDEPGLVGHYQVQPSTSCNGFATKTDPGPYFDWAR